MEILRGIEIRGKGLWIKKHKILVIGDLHIGYEEALAKQGVSVPAFMFRELKKELVELVEETRPKKIIINGDLKHEFGDISTQEWRETTEILEFLEKNCEEVILIKGNHDKILEPIAKKMNMKIVNSYYIEESQKEGPFGLSIKSIGLVHGDRISTDPKIMGTEVLIIGHEHPAITLREGGKQEKYKCFLVGKWKHQKLIVLPSFMPLIEGTDVNNEKLLSPYLHQDIGNFDVYIVGDKVYKFGKLKHVSD